MSEVEDTSLEDISGLRSFSGLGDEGGVTTSSGDSYNVMVQVKAFTFYKNFKEKGEKNTVLKIKIIIFSTS